MSDEFSHGAKKLSLLPCLLAALLLAGCGSDDDNPSANTSSSAASSSSSSAASSSSVASDAVWPDINITGAGAGSLRVSWTEVADASFYRLYKDPDGASGFSQVGDDLNSPEAFDTISVHLTDWPEARYMVEACVSASQCSNSNEQTAAHAMLDTIGYLKASNTDAGDWFGWSLDLSSDGTTLAVGAPQEDSQARGVNGDQTDNATFAAGAVYVLTKNQGTWQQQAYLKASNTEAPFTDDDDNTLVRGQDRFGYSVALSDDGNTLAVGALREDSNATGVNGDDSDNSAYDAGAVYLFQRSDNTWAQTAYVKASNTPQQEAASSSSSSSSSMVSFASSSSSSSVTNTAGDRFGHAVALSGDGKTLAVAALGEDSSAGGINGDESLNDTPSAGAVYVFANSADNWSQQAYVKAATPLPHDQFGASLALDYSGDTLAVGASHEDLPGNGVNQEIPEKTRFKGDSGAVFVFTRSGDDWSQAAYIKPDYSVRIFNRSSRTTDYSNLYFGSSVSLSRDGKRLAVGATGDGSQATGVNGPADDYPELADDYDGSISYVNSGAAYIFDRQADGWQQTHYLKAATPTANDQFGASVRLSGDGQYVAVGAYLENSNATGINGDDSNQTANNSGAVTIFAHSDGSWQQRSYVKAPISDSQDRLGRSLALSADGSLLAAGAYREAGSGTGTDADPSDNNADAAGAVFLY
jgi:hypothetical protein